MRSSSSDCVVPYGPHMDNLPKKKKKKKKKTSRLDTGCTEWRRGTSQPKKNGTGATLSGEMGEQRERRYLRTPPVFWL